MQHNLRTLIGYAIRATDGDLGKVHDFYFDDTTWTIRYIVVETKNWLSSRKILISLVALDKPDWRSDTLRVNLTCLQVRNSPDIDTQRPVYRQHEAELHTYYQWAPYWDIGYGGTFGLTPYPLFENLIKNKPSGSNLQDDPHLRSARQVMSYRIHATEGEIGSVDDFVFDEETWLLNYVIVNTGNWLLGRQVLIPTKWITSLHWEDKNAYIDRSREDVDNSPGYDPLQPYMTPSTFERLSLTHSQESITKS